jgi:hypothetical protein
MLERRGPVPVRLHPLGALAMVVRPAHPLGQLVLFALERFDGLRKRFELAPLGERQLARRRGTRAGAAALAAEPFAA